MPISSATNSGPWVGMVPSVTGTRFFCASDPAMASTATIGQKRPINMRGRATTL